MKPLLLAFIALTLVKVASSNAAAPPPKVLFLTQSAGFVHSVVNRHGGPFSLAETQLAKAAAGQFEVVSTQDCGAITTANLAPFSAIVFYTSGELPMNDESKRAFVDFVKSGGGFVGIHSATDTFYNFPEYGELIGGYLNGHPPVAVMKIKVEDKKFPATSHLGDSFEITDEAYQFKSWDASKVHMLLRIDPTSVGLMRKPNLLSVRGNITDETYAVAWSKMYGKGKVFYTALGHSDQEWKDDRFLKHVVNGITWSLGTPTSSGSLARVVPPASSAPASVSTDASQSSIETLSQQGPNAIEWTLAPLDQSVPGDIRQNLTFLREALLDEGKQNPKAIPDAYKLGSQICNGLLAALDERSDALARAGFRAVEANARTGVTNQALEARRNFQMSWPQFARENAQRAELKSQAINSAAVIAERPRVEWATRTASLRKPLDTLYSQFREAVRQSPLAK